MARAGGGVGPMGVPHGVSVVVYLNEHPQRETC